jgi:nucleotide-binding universal stress UspA family protein
MAQCIHLVVEIWKPNKRKLCMNILIGFDGSNTSKAAMRAAQKHALALNSRLDVVTVVVRHSTDQSEEITKAEKSLELIQNDCEQKGITCQTKLLIREREAGEALVEYAAEMEYEELIIGVKKRSRVEKLLLGSNAQYIILNAPCPVLSVREA